jgi:hypothetical protein
MISIATEHINKKYQLTDVESVISILRRYYGLPGTPQARNITVEEKETITGLISFLKLAATAEDYDDVVQDMLQGWGMPVDIADAISKCVANLAEGDIFKFSKSVVTLVGVKLVKRGWKYLSKKVGEIDWTLGLDKYMQTHIKTGRHKKAKMTYDPIQMGKKIKHAWDVVEGHLSLVGDAFGALSSKLFKSPYKKDKHDVNKWGPSSNTKTDYAITPQVRNMLNKYKITEKQFRKNPKMLEQMIKNRISTYEIARNKTNKELGQWNPLLTPYTGGLRGGHDLEVIIHIPDHRTTLLSRTQLCKLGVEIPSEPGTTPLSWVWDALYYIVILNDIEIPICDCYLINTSLRCKIDSSSYSECLEDYGIADLGHFVLQQRLKGGGRRKKKKKSKKGFSKGYMKGTQYVQMLQQRMPQDTARITQKLYLFDMYAEEEVKKVTLIPVNPILLQDSVFGDYALAFEEWMCLRFTARYVPSVDTTVTGNIFAGFIAPTDNVWNTTRFKTNISENGKVGHVQLPMSVTLPKEKKRMMKGWNPCVPPPGGGVEIYAVFYYDQLVETAETIGTIEVDADYVFRSINNSVDKSVDSMTRRSELTIVDGTEVGEVQSVGTCFIVDQPVDLGQVKLSLGDCMVVTHRTNGGADSEWAYYRGGKVYTGQEMDGTLYGILVETKSEFMN